MAHENTHDVEPISDHLPAPPAYRDPVDSTRSRDRYEKSGRYGIMFAPELEWDATRCIQEAYGDSDYTPRSQAYDGERRRSLKFHTGWHTLEDARDLVREMPPYNRFNPNHVREALGLLDDPARVALGRESSPVLYVWTDTPRTAMDALDSVRERSDDGNGVFAPAGPDELGAVLAPDVDFYPLQVVGTSPECVDDGTPALCRFWWD